jgi:two-component system response regulator AtoC
MRLLTEYSWPGNIRELENSLERIVLISDKEILGQKEIEQELTTRSAQESESVPVAPAVTQPADLSSATATEPPVNTIDLGEIKTLKELEYEAIVAGLARTKWNLTTTARQLGISRMTLYRKLDQHDLRKKD